MKVIKYRFECDWVQFLTFVGLLISLAALSVSGYGIFVAATAKSKYTDQCDGELAIFLQNFGSLTAINYFIAFVLSVFFWDTFYDEENELVDIIICYSGIYSMFSLIPLITCTNFGISRTDPNCIWQHSSAITIFAIGLASSLPVILVLLYHIVVGVCVMVVEVVPEIVSKLNVGCCCEIRKEIDVV